MTDPAGASNKPLLHIREVLVTIPSFLAWTGLDAEASRGKVKFHHYDVQRSDRPICIVGHPDESVRDGAAFGQTGLSMASTARLLIEGNASANDSDSEKLIKFENAVAFMDHFRSCAISYGFRCTNLVQVLPAMIGWDEFEDGPEPFCSTFWDIMYADLL